MGDLSRRCLVDGGAAVSDPDIPDLGEIGADIWAVAEETAKEVMCCVHPTLDSEEKRRDVIEYLQRLIRTSLGCEVFPYGSVPLKTYLPDGDIDLTAVSSLTAMDTLPRDVFAVLQAQENNQYADYKVKDTQFIDAEVKLVKCLVENIVIDLSFNQLGGISTLCFLEQVDRCVGKNHLFKRSIILVKAWCYYESRILGAHHGLISTYAMETLVLYIFHLFHASLDGPLVVLYKFLDYFSKFDWDNYCISLNGPVSLSCLPDIVVEMTHGVQSDYLLSEEFLRNCLDVFSVPFGDADTKLQVFSPKHLNIIDPLKENNNLGRSVNIGNFYRIRSAFRYGAQKLGRIFTLPRERIADEINRFFANTFKRPGCNSRNLGRSFYSRSFSLYLESNTDGVSDLDRYSTEINHIPMASMMGQTTGEMEISLSHSAVEMYPRPANYRFDCSSSAMYSKDFISQYYTPCFQSFPESWKFENWTFNDGKQTKSIHEKEYSYSLIGEMGENHLRPCGLGCYRSDNYEKDLVDIVESRDNSNPLSDLSGDYESNVRSLLYGQSWLRHLLFGPLMPYPPATFGSQFVRKSTAHRSMSMTHCSSSRFIDNRVNLAWATQSVIIPGQSNLALCIEPMHNKPRGTRTRLPNGYAWRETPSHRMGISHGSGNYRQYQHAQLAHIVPEKKSSDIGGGDTGHEQLPGSPSPALHHEKTEIPQESNTSAFDGSQTYDFFCVLQKLEFGSLGNLPDVSSLRASDTSSGWGSIPSQVKSAELLSGSNNERVGKQSYHLKDEDFPPLTV